MYQRNRWMLCILVLLAVSKVHSEKDEPHRLPKNLKPEYYNLIVETHLNEYNNVGYKFNGNVTITVLCDKSTRDIVLHSRDLITENIRVEQLDEKNDRTVIEVDSTSVDPKYDYLKIHLKEELIAGQRYTISIDFYADLSESLLGYYRLHYEDPYNKTHWITTSEFQPLFARQSFPCFDEPELKAKFEIHLIHDSKWNAISNMPLKSTVSVSKKDHLTLVKDTFEVSKPMSTYMLYYSINDYQSRVADTNVLDDVVFRTWTRPQFIDQVQYANSIGPKMLKFYEDYFDKDYPLPKMDQIALPQYLGGNSENWGMTGYRETSILFRENVSRLEDKYGVARFMSHELAHQWIGNLVTHKWWSDLWLKEGLAHYLAPLTVDHIHPEWGYHTEEIMDHIFKTHYFDGFSVSKPLSREARIPQEIDDLFSPIQFSKGANLIRMIQNIVGEDSFRKGLMAYIDKYEYKNADSEDFLNTMTEVAHKAGVLPKEQTLKNIMDAWIHKSGYPVIVINRDLEKNEIEITQKRFIWQFNRTSEDSSNCWWIPLTFTTQDELDFETTKPKEWVECDSENKPVAKKLINVPIKDKWILFNVKFSGLYKVMYDNHTMKQLINVLNSNDYKKIPPMNRAQLVRDVMDLAWSGDHTYELAFELIEYLKQEREYLPWKAALDSLSRVENILIRTDLYPIFQTYLQQIITPLYESFGGLTLNSSVGSSTYDMKLRLIVLQWACQTNTSDCNTKSLQMVKDLNRLQDIEKENPIPIDLRPIVYCGAMRYGSDEVFDLLFERYRKSQVVSEQTSILNSLFCSENPAIAVRILRMTSDPTSGIRKRDTLESFDGLSRNPRSYMIARDYLEHNVDAVYEDVGKDSGRMERFLRPLSSQTVFIHELDDFASFVDRNEQIFGKESRAVRHGMEEVRTNYEWYNRNYKNMERILRKLTSDVEAKA